MEKKGREKERSGYWPGLCNQLLDYLKRYKPQRLSTPLKHQEQAALAKNNGKPPKRAPSAKELEEKKRQEETDIALREEDALLLFIELAERLGEQKDEDGRSYKPNSPPDITRGCEWPLRFAPESFSKLRKLVATQPERAIDVIERILSHAHGHISPNVNCEVLMEGPYVYTIFYNSIIANNIKLLWMTTVEKCDGQFYQVLIVIGIADSEKAAKGAVHRFSKSMSTTHSYLDPSASSSSSDPRMDTQKALPELKKNDGNIDRTIMHPLQFEKIEYKPNTLPKFKDPNLQQGELPAKEALETGENANLSVINAQEALVENLSSQENCAELIGLLQELPSLGLQLSEEEKAVIRYRGNVLLIGRSGTGKTTCAVLRMWARNKLFNYIANKENKESETETETSTSHEEKIQFNSVFLTLSPVLCKQVQRYYNKLDAKTSGGQTVIEKKLGISATLTDESGAGPDAGEEEEAEQFDSNSSEKKNPLLATSPNADSSFPLFSTIKEFLRMIDETLKEPFFVKTEEAKKLNLGITINWNSDESSQPVLIRKKNVKEIIETKKRSKSKALKLGTMDLGLLGFDSDGDVVFLNDDSDEDDDEGDVSDDDLETEDANAKKKSVKHKIFETIETSFEVGYHYFSTILWDKITTTSDRKMYHPSLIWTEIISYIKGSAEALQSPTGYLTQEMYLKLGAKRTPLPKGDRNGIYQIFRRYEAEKKGFDMPDMIYHIYSRLRHEGYRGTPIHAITVDEVQDFTQATLQLLFSVCKQRTGFFFTGDTCQTITRGLGFRFAELQTVIYEKKKANPLMKMEVPEIQQLLVNYRSHSNLLKLSNSVISLLETLFPNSIDKLKHDNGTRTGPIPVILNTTLDELFLILFGSGAHNSNIEFGAHQVVIVREQESKKRLPEALQGAMVLTVYESKGLEFEDVILFDFFNDSPCNSWEFGVNKESNPDPLLCSELKHLYTAITRAKSRLFIFDRNTSKTTALYARWIKDNLVTCIERTGEIGESIIKRTSKEEWKQLGHVMLKNKHYTQAIKCFTYAECVPYRRKAEALQKALQADELLQKSEAAVKEKEKNKAKQKNRKKEASAMAAQAREQFREASDIFTSLGLPKYAARCLASCGDYLTAAKIFEANSCWKEAAHCYYSAEQFERSGELFFKCGQLEEALLSFEKGGLWNSIIDTLKQSKSLFTKEALSNHIKKYVPIIVERIAKEQNKAEDTWAVVKQIMVLVNIQEETPSEIALSGTFDSTVLERLEHYGLYELCLRLLVENSKRMDAELEFDHDTRIEEYAGIICYLYHRSDLTAVKRICLKLLACSNTAAISYLLRYGLWTEAAQLLEMTNNPLQAAAIYQSFSAYDKARQLYTKALEKSSNANLITRLMLNNSMRDIWRRFKVIDSGNEEGLEELQHITKATLNEAIKNKNQKLANRLTILLNTYNQTIESSFSDLQKLLEKKNDLFTQLFLLNKLLITPLTKEDKSNLIGAQKTIVICEEIFKFVLNLISAKVDPNSEEVRDQQEQLNLFFELQDPAPFTIPRTSYGGGHAFYIIQRSHPFTIPIISRRNQRKKENKTDPKYRKLVGEVEWDNAFTVDEGGQYFYISLSEAYLNILNFIVLVAVKFYKIVQDKVLAQYREYQSEVALYNICNENSVYLHRIGRMKNQVKSLHRNSLKAFDKSKINVCDIYRWRYSRLPPLSRASLNEDLSHFLLSVKDNKDHISLLSGINHPEVLVELAQRSEEREVYAPFVESLQFKSVKNYVDAAASFESFLNESLPESDVAFLIQQHVAILLTIAAHLSDSSEYYIPQSFQIRHIDELLDKNGTFTYVKTPSTTMKTIESLLKKLCSWAMHYLANSREPESEVGMELIITVLIVALHVEYPSQGDYEFRTFLGQVEFDEVLMDILDDCNLKTGGSWNGDDFFYWMDGRGDSLNPIDISKVDAETYDAQKVEEQLAQLVFNKTKRVVAAIKMSYAYKKYLSRRVSEPGQLHARLASQYLLKAFCQSVPSKEVQRAAEQITNYDCKIAQLNMMISSALKFNSLLHVPAHIKEFESILNKLALQRKKNVKWFQSSCADQVSISLNKSSDDTEFVVIGKDSYNNEVKVDTVVAESEELLSKSSIRLKQILAEVEDQYNRENESRLKAENNTPEALEKKRLEEQKRKRRGAIKQAKLQQKRDIIKKRNPFARWL